PTDAELVLAVVLRLSHGWQKEQVPVLEDLPKITFDSAYFSALTCRLTEDFRLAALFLWTIPVLASLSSMELTSGRSFSASALSVVPRSLRTALRVVLCWYRLRSFRVSDWR